MSTKTLTHLELFAGIGGFRKAIALLGENLGFGVTCKGFSEIDKYAITSYKANYNTEGEVEMGDIAKFVEDKDSLNKIGNTDFVFGGFPCQPFSMMGEKGGFRDIRGGLFFKIIKLLKVVQPKYILLENVRNIVTHNKGETIKKIEESLEKDAGYKIHYDIFNTSSFGLPQHRRRVFIFGIRKDLYKGDIDFSAQSIKDYISNKGLEENIYTYEHVLDGILDKKVPEKYFLSEKIKPTILSNGSKNFKSKSEINQLIARPLTATMVKMHRACQDNYYSEGFLRSRNPFKYVEKSFSKEEQAKHNIRKLTPREALKLQGFSHNFYERASSVGVSNHQLYKQAGNAVSINTVYSILKYLHDFNYVIV